MNNKIRLTFFLSVIFLLVFAMYSSAQSNNPHKKPTPMSATPATGVTQNPQGPIRKPVELPKVPQGPECASHDKGSCSAVCNPHKVPGTGEVNEAGCMAEFKHKPKGALCPTEGEQVEYVGCDETSAQKCTTANGATGFWCNCYYNCYDPSV